jgi:seryl-tRNA synthetase
MAMPVRNSPPAQVQEGLATLGPELVRLRQTLDAKFLAWAAEYGADAMLFPPLMRVADLARFDYFHNFPHLPLLVTRLREERLHDIAHHAGELATIASSELGEAGYALPSAACYNIYLHLAGSVLSSPRYVSTVATCFRNENAYEELRRLWGFTMREIVCIGPQEAVQEHLMQFKRRVLSFGDRLGLALEVKTGSDPFYEPQSSRAVMQQLFPQKEEFLYQGTLAIASVNFHRNFFGERCNIHTGDGQPAFTGCVAFGIERWLHALVDRFQQDAGAAEKAVASS